MQKQIIIINGTGGCGKDTFVQYVSKYKKVKNFSSVDKVKEVAKLIGWQGSKDEKDRKFLSDLKRLTTDYNDMSFNDTLMAVDSFLDSDDEIMFIHIREPREIERTKDRVNAITLLIQRVGHENICSNTSDRDVNEYNYDYIISNNTLEELEENAKEFIASLSSHEKRSLKKWMHV